jgi:hypothetical protein
MDILVFYMSLCPYKTYDAVTANCSSNCFQKVSFKFSYTKDLINILSMDFSSTIIFKNAISLPTPATNDIVQITVVYTALKDSKGYV